MASQFSTFVVFHVPNWVAQFEATEPSDGGESGSGLQPLDTTFVIDSSGSMDWNDPNGYRKLAAKEFVGALVDGDRAGVVDFDGSATVTQSLTGDFDAVNASIDALDASGGTDIGDGLQASNDHFDAASNDSRAKVSILLTDGQGSGGIAEAEAAAARSITIYTIGFGGADEAKLQQIANETGGEYHFVDSASDLPEVFSRVADNVSGTDSDGDGLLAGRFRYVFWLNSFGPDYVEAIGREHLESAPGSRNSTTTSSWSSRPTIRSTSPTSGQTENRRSPTTSEFRIRDRLTELPRWPSRASLRCRETES